MSAHSEFRQHSLETLARNSGNFGLGAQQAQWSQPKRLCTKHMKLNMCFIVNKEITD